MSKTKPEQNNIKKLVLFDIDQTMVNSGGAGRKAIYQALQKCLPISIEKLQQINIRMHGKTDPQIIAEFIAAGVDEPQLFSAGIAADWQEKIDETLATYIELLPIELEKVRQENRFIIYDGVFELLDVLSRNNNIALGLLTGNIEKGARIKLEPELIRYFPIGAYGCDSANRLDLPAIAHKRAQDYYSIGLMPAEIVIIGDAENDVLCAKHYGAVSLAVNTGTTTWDELKSLSPDYLFPSLKDTAKIEEAILADTKVLR